MTAPDPRLNEIQARLDAVTDGPWEHQPYGGQNQNGDYAGGYIIDGHGEWLISDVPDHDGPFIAAAPADVRYLLTELRKAHEALAVVDEWIGKFEKTQSSDAAKRENAQFDLGHSSGRRAAGSILRAAVAAAKGDEQ